MNTFDNPPEGFIEVTAEMIAKFDAERAFADEPAYGEQAKPNGAKQRFKPPIKFTAAELGMMIFPPLEWIVPDVLAPGLTLLAGAPKLGKSWFALDLGLGVARGDYVLGDKLCAQGDVLMLCLEDNARRLRARIEKLNPPHCADPFPQNLLIATESDRSDKGGVDYIRDWIEHSANPKLIVIDVLASFRPLRSGGEANYDSDYAALAPLQAMAGEFNIAILVVHHTRKMAHDGNPFDAISGTNGLAGCSDAAMILSKTGVNATLYTRGRDVPPVDFAVSFSSESCRWRIEGLAEEVVRGDERQAILDALMEAENTMTVSDIVTATGMRRNSCDQLLHKMGKDRQVHKAIRGHYYHPDRTDLAPSTPDKISKKIRNSDVEGGDDG